MESPNPNEQVTASSVPNDGIEEIRQKLVDTAATFLRNPQVQGSPLAQKTSFLKAKGLTPAEISMALEQAGVSQTDTGPSVTTAAGNNMMALQQTPPPAKRPWGWKDYFIGATMAVGAAYFVKDYILPALQSPMKKVEDDVNKLNDSISELHKDLADQNKSVQDTLNLLKTELAHNKRSQQSSAQDNMAVREVQTDVAAIKSMLLNRNRFPPAPVPTVPGITTPLSSTTGNVGIPAWQRAPAAPKTTTTTATANSTPPASATKPSATAVTSPGTQSPALLPKTPLTASLPASPSDNNTPPPAAQHHHNHHPQSSLTTRRPPHFAATTTTPTSNSSLHQQTPLPASPLYRTTDGSKTSTPTVATADNDEGQGEDKGGLSSVEAPTAADDYGNEDEVKMAGTGDGQDGEEKDEGDGDQETVEAE